MIWSSLFSRLSAFVCLAAAAWLAGVCPASAQRAYTDLPVVKEGKTIRISPHVYVIPDENRRGVPNVGIVVGSRATLVIDPGMGLKSGRAVLNEATKISKGNAIILVTTHLHPEHITGIGAFPQESRLVRAVRQQQDIEENAHKWVAEFSERSPELAELLKEATGFRKPDETFEREQTLDLGGVRVRLLLLGPGHTPGDTVIFVEGDGVLFSGDLAMKQAFPAFTSAQSRTDTWLTALDAMDGLRPTKIVGAHYGTGDASIIAAYRDYMTTLRQRVGQLKSQGKSADETAKIMRAECQAKFPDWDQVARVELAATVTYAQLP